WTQIGGVFWDEEPTPYRGEDHLVDPALLTPLTAFTTLVSQARADGRLDALIPLQINEAFDARGGHDVGKPMEQRSSRHFEGRALDIHGNGEFLQRLTGLAMLAGFAWSYNEISHLHVSHTGSAAEVSPLAISKAILYGVNNGLILS